MLETSQERVELLRAGISGKKIEELYILFNNIKIFRLPVVFVNEDIMESKKISNVEVSPNYGIALKE